MTIWIDQLRLGSPNAARQLWNLYYRPLVHLARKKLAGRARLVDDDEDVALSAFQSFCRGLQCGRFAKIADRDDLWNLLVTITLRKVLHLIRDARRAKRGGDANLRGPAEDEAAILHQLACTRPAPEVAVHLADEIDRLLAQLPTPELVELALLKLEGFTNAEISARWQKTERTVERKLKLVRGLWQRFESNCDPEVLRNEGYHV